MADPRVDDLVSAVADGESIDWYAAKRHLARDSDALVASLEFLSTLNSRNAPPEDASHATTRLPAAAHALVVLAAIQTGLGVVGLIVNLDVVGRSLTAARLASLISFGAAAALLVASRRDRRAAWLGGFYLLIAASFGQPGLRPLFESIGAPAFAKQFARGFIAEAFLPAFLWQFTRVFPTVTRFTVTDEVASFALRLSVAAGVVLFLANHLVAFGVDGPAVMAVDRAKQASGFWTVVLSLSLAALLVMMTRSRAAPAQERQRVALFLLAIVAGALPVVGEVLLESVWPPFADALNRPSVYRIVAVAVFVPLLAVPFMTAYAVLLRQVLDVRLLVRKGTRYLLARRMLSVLTLLPFAGLAAYVIAHREETLSSLLSRPEATLLIGVGAVAATALAFRRRLQERIDRWFVTRLEEHSDVLAQVAADLRYARTPGELGRVAARGITRALDAEALLMMHDTTIAAYRPVQGSRMPLAMGSALVAWLNEQRDSCNVDPDDPQSIYRWLPVGERQWVQRCGVAMLVPLARPGEAMLNGILACGPRRNAVRFETNDGRFLTALAAACGIALDNVALRRDKTGAPDEAPQELAEQCRACGALHLAAERRPLCTCGGALEPASLPKLLLDKYSLERLLGTGGMGVVYLATDLTLGRAVALKTLPRLEHDSAIGLRHEARTMASLAHPHLATIYGAETWRGMPLLVVEYLPGGTLADRLASRPTPTQEALTLGIALAKALEYMHARGVLHRDLKPANVGFATDGEPKLLDFGLAKLFGPSHDSASLNERPAGTLLYMSPEALGGHPADAAFDIWALSVLFFQMITGSHPFGSNREGVFRILDPDRSHLHGLLRECLEPFQAFFQAALAYDKGKRFATAEELRRQMQALRSAVL